MSLLAERLKELRKRNNYAQWQLADKLGVCQQAVAKWETKHGTPTPDMLIRIADIFHVSVDYLIGHDV